MSDRAILRRGSFGQDVAAWQRAIGITPDGIFGAQTERATRSWQASRGLEPDGIVGPLTWAALGQASTSPPPYPPVERLVPTVQTPVSMADLALALRAVWPEGTRRQAGILWAHLAGETGGGRHCYNHNLGNMKHVAGDGRPYFSLRGVWEGFLVRDEDKDGDVDDADRALLLERLVRSGAWAPDPNPDHARAVGPQKIAVIATTSNPTTYFVAYNSLEAGVRSFVDAKRSPTSRYAVAWRYVLAADPEGYAYALGMRGYYTADPKIYAAAMRRGFETWLRDAPAFPEA